MYSLKFESDLKLSTKWSWVVCSQRSNNSEVVRSLASLKCLSRSWNFINQTSLFCFFLQSTFVSLFRRFRCLGISNVLSNFVLHLGCQTKQKEVLIYSGLDSFCRCLSFWSCTTRAQICLKEIRLNCFDPNLEWPLHAYVTSS
jgi:hypothetical protein